MRSKEHLLGLFEGEGKAQGDQKEMNCRFLQRDGAWCALNNEHCEPFFNERRNYDDRLKDPPCPDKDPIWQMIQRCWKIVGRCTRDDEEMLHSMARKKQNSGGE